MPSRLKLRTKGRFIETPLLNGEPVDRVTKVEFTADAFDLPQVTLHVMPDVVFNGKAWVLVKNVDLDVPFGAKSEFANALNEADLRARQKARNAAREAAGLPPSSRRSEARLEQSTSAEALIDEMDALGWGFYRKRS
jgi:hypothetical protein